MILKCIVIDDDAEAIKDISEYISNIPNLDLVRSFTKPVEALRYIKDTEGLDLVFIDVDMPLISGIELSLLIRENTKKLVFTTSHAKYALDAFDVSADGFLLKPFNFAKFLRTVNKLFPPEKMAGTKDNDYLFIKSKEEYLKLIKVKYTDIVAIESMLNYVRIHTVKDKLITHITLKEFRETLKDRDEFVQLHRSFIISKNHIFSIDGNTLTMTTGAKFTIGESYRDILISFLSDKVLKPIKKR